MVWRAMKVLQTLWRKAKKRLDQFSQRKREAEAVRGSSRDMDWDSTASVMELLDSARCSSLPGRVRGNKGKWIADGSLARRRGCGPSGNRRAQNGNA